MGTVVILLRYWENKLVPSGLSASVINIIHALSDVTVSHWPHGGSSEPAGVVPLGQDRTGQGRAGQDRTGQDRTGQDKKGRDGTGRDTSGPTLRLAGKA